MRRCDAGHATDNQQASIRRLSKRHRLDPADAARGVGLGRNDPRNLGKPEARAIIKWLRNWDNNTVCAWEATDHA